MTRVRVLLAFLYDFLVGDDPLIAAIVVAALALTAAVASTSAAAWLVLPPAVLAALTFSVLRAARRTPPRS